MIGGRILAGALFLRLLAPVTGAAEVAPVLVQSAPGRFEVAAIDAADAHRLAALGEECWRLLAVPLGLPSAFSSPVFVRVLPASAEGLGREGFRVNIEAGGVVSVWLRVDQLGLPAGRQALVRGLLNRLGVALHGATETPTVPRWLEQAAVGWWRTRADAAHFDEAKQRAARLEPPPIAALLDWRHTDPERPDWSEAALWLLTFLQNESGRADEWALMRQRLLAGGDPQAMLAQCYPGRFSGVAARELWWQTGWHYARRLHSLPVLEAEESRVRLAGLARFVFAAPGGASDRVAALREVIARGGEPLVQAEVARRVAELGRLVPAMHPFYRNAALSLAEALAAAGRNPAAGERGVAQFERDWRDGRTLEEASTAALDRYERAPAPP